MERHKSMLQVTRSKLFQVFGYKGMIKAENQQPIHALETYNGTENISRPPIYFSFASRFQNGYINEMEHFLDVLEGWEVRKCIGY